MVSSICSVRCFRYDKRLLELQLWVSFKSPPREIEKFGLFASANNTRCLIVGVPPSIVARSAAVSTERTLVNASGILSPRFPVSTPRCFATLCVAWRAASKKRIPYLEQGQTIAESSDSLRTTAYCAIFLVFLFFPFFFVSSRLSVTRFLLPPLRADSRRNPLSPRSIFFLPIFVPVARSVNRKPA